MYFVIEHTTDLTSSWCEQLCLASGVDPTGKMNGGTCSERGYGHKIAHVHRVFIFAKADDTSFSEAAGESQEAATADCDSHYKVSDDGRLCEDFCIQRGEQADAYVNDHPEGLPHGECKNQPKDDANPFSKLVAEH